MYAYYNGNSWGLEDTQRSSPLNDTPGYAGADPWFLNRGKAEYWGAAEADCQCQAPRVGRWGLGRGLPLQWGMVWGPTAWEGASDYIQRRCQSTGTRGPPWAVLGGTWRARGARASNCMGSGGRAPSGVQGQSQARGNHFSTRGSRSKITCLTLSEVSFFDPNLKF